jgi:hypothetical protein
MTAAGLLLLCLAGAAGGDPGVRNGHRLAYDAARRAVLLFGGAGHEKVGDDLWAWDGRGWRMVEASGPGPRTFPAFAFDAARGEAVVFGGNRVLFGPEGVRDTLLDDTWVHGRGEWSRRDAPGPSVRAEAAAAYDAHRRVVVLFGGYQRTAQGNLRLGDTWEWDGARWKRAADGGPPPRSGAAMAYDDRRRRIVLFGGRAPEALSPETWEWDGARWTRVAAGDAEPRFNPVMAFDGRRGTMVRFGGWTGRERTADTWLFRFPAWTRLDASGPSARNHSAMAYDEARGRTVLFGGHDGTRVFGDTWEWDGRRWLLRRSVLPLARVDNGH